MKELDKQFRKANISRKQRRKIKDDANDLRKQLRKDKRNNSHKNIKIISDDPSNSNVLPNISRKQQRKNKKNIRIIADDSDSSSDYDDSSDTEDSNKEINTLSNITITNKCEKCISINLRKCICLKCKRLDCCNDEYCIYWILD